VLRYAIVGGGLLLALFVLIKYHRGTLTLADTRYWLANLVGIEFGIILLIATNTAATAITKERESNSMDILLTTPLRAVDLVWGKLRGLVSFTLPPICVPVGSLLLFTLYDLLARSKQPVVFGELWLELALLMVAYAAFACMLGLHFSLRIKRTVKAVMVSVGVMTLICLAALLLAQAVISSLDEGGAFVAAFTPLSAVNVLVNPASLFNDDAAALAANSRKVRVFAFWGACVAGTLVYLLVAGLYKSMVRNFDMVVRKQSGL
jgi:ABC-type Na+ efflux pump permease subunit